MLNCWRSGQRAGLNQYACLGSDCCLILSREKAEEIVALAQGSWRNAANYLHIWAAETANHQKKLHLADND